MPMLRFTRHFLLVASLLGFALAARATHNRAGEITYEQIGPLTLRATITTYTKTSSVAADRDSLEICWGDGSCQWVQRANGNGNGQPLPNDIKYNIYVATHTYPGLGTYTISMQDPNRNGGILNVNPPNSDNVPFFIQSTFTFLSAQFQGVNNSPLLLQPPVDVGYVGQPFVHNPNAFDQEGDSLAYELILPSQDVNTPVVNFTQPHLVAPQPGDFLTIDAITGDLVWSVPRIAGEYNVAFLIKEYRQGQLISSIVRDMQITILEGDNRPPVVESLDEICVVAGDVLTFPVVATDPDVPEQLLELTALGGPLSITPSPASFSAPAGFQPQPVQGTFTWATACEHISDQYYQVVFKAQDDFNDTFGLSTLKTVRIKVVGPPPLDVQAEPASGQVTVSWENPYACDEVADDYFIGFSVWRRLGSNPFEPDTCTPGLAGQGYTRIAAELFDVGADGRYAYVDTDVERGRSYCYRVLGEFARTSAAGQFYNLVESLPSEEICVQLSRDIPILTNVSVLSTDVASGEMDVRWTKPLASDLDTLQNPGPYVYVLRRGEGFDPAALTTVATFSSPTFAGANDTTFTDTGLNTLQRPYTYQLAFFVNGESTPVGETPRASSVFLSIASSDQQNTLSWAEDVPWDNLSYTVYRQNPLSGQFDSIAQVSGPSYTDGGLNNGQEYCYYVRSEGTYQIEGVPDPLFNLSQEACGTPIDTLAPCPPSLTVANLCGVLGEDAPASDFINTLTWTNPNNTCPDSAGVQQYNVYYAPSPGSAFSIIETLNRAEDSSYAHLTGFTAAGCYAVSAIDSVGNEGALSNTVCVDNCPVYTLPNAFTPNGDGDNELFIPYPYRFIARIDLKIYDVWGNLVFSSTNPDINWDGTNLAGEPLAEAVYYYTCQVFELRLDGEVPRPDPLSGYIQLVRGQ